LTRLQAVAAVQGVEGPIGQRAMDGIPRLVRLRDKGRLPRLLDLLDDAHQLLVVAGCCEQSLDRVISDREQDASTSH